MRFVAFVALSLVLGLAYGDRSLGDDVRRAVQKIPRDAFRGHGRANTNRVLSGALRRTVTEAGGATKPCEHFRVSELIDIQRVLFAARDPALESIYAAAGDARRLGTFGAQADDVVQLEQLWAEELALLADAPHLHGAARDAKCYEAAMWFAHHVPAAARADVVQVIALPELPAGSGVAIPGGPSAARFRQASSGCTEGHFFPGTGDLINSTTIPRAYPISYSADMTNCNAFTKPVPRMPRDCGMFSPCTNPRGKIWYDFSGPFKRKRIDFESGACHQVVGNAAPGHFGPANEYTGPGTILDAPDANGASTQYVFWPELKQCCQCCGAKDGCGVVRPDWLARGNATLVQGKRILVDDSEKRLSDVWHLKAGQNNYMYIDSATGLPVGYRMNMTADELDNPLIKVTEKWMHRNLSDWTMVRTLYNVSTAPIDPSVFALPGYCKTATGVLNKCSGLWCPLMRA